jgi:hypothetical protein
MTPDDIRKLPGLKRKEITNCELCGNGLAKNGQFVFYRVRVEQYVLDGNAINRRHGLETFFGGGGAGALLAQAMGDDEDLAKQMSDSKPRLVCQGCAIDSAMALPRLLEAVAEKEVEREPG